MQVERPVLFIGYGALFIAGVPLYLISVAVHYLLLTFEASREAERRALESQVATREAELRALRAQLNPHFLFNSLNSINALVGSDPEAARRMCESLGDFLRRTLALGARDAVSLGEELALVDRYLAIERVRFGERLRVECRLEPAVERCLVPPLLLQPLVENAIKHGIAERIEGGTVRIAAARHDGVLTIEVENDVDSDAPPRRGEGVGLANVRRRLDAIDARNARLDVRRIADQFRVTLTLPAQLAEPAAAPALAPATGGGADGGR
jgi:LytS/YehU family sensor histidine kinase